jgi:hypothetical protein
MPLPGHEDTLQGTCFAGQLTVEGHDELVAVGKYFGAFYKDLMSQLKPENFVVRADMVQRTVDSSIAFLEGLAPPFPVSAIYQVESKYDDMSINPSFCPRVAQYVLEHYKTYEPLLRMILPHSVELIKIFHSDDPFEGVQKFDDLYCRQRHNMPLPQGLTTPLYDVLADAKNLVNMLIVNDTYLSISSFCQDIVAKMNNNKAEPEVFIYSGHDTTVAPLMRMMDLLAQWPQYGDHVAFELFVNSGDHSDRQVQVRYNGDIVVPMQPLSVFSKMFLMNVPQDLAKYCHVKV